MEYIIVLRDDMGGEISRRTRTHLSKAKKQAHYLASEDYADTIWMKTHEALRSSHAEVIDEAGAVVYVREVE